MIAIGNQAPDFSLSDQDGKTHSLSQYVGRWVLLYFYPKDMTPGCTKEACMIRDAFPRFEQVHAHVFGVSADSIESHKKFRDSFELPFSLLSDPEKEMISSYGAWGEKKMMGKTYMGIKRMSVLIDPEGRVRKIYEQVKPEVHAEEVLADLKEFGA